MKCNYCKEEAEWVSNAEVYGKTYGNSTMIWLCRPCDAYVGCHKNTQQAYGSLANKEVRKLRHKAKNMFIDKCLKGDWNCNPHRKRISYARLGGLMKIKQAKMHFGMFQKEECLLAIEIMDKHKFN